MLRPILDRVVVRKLDQQKQTPGGIILPDTMKDQRRLAAGVVVAVGPGRYNDAGVFVVPGTTPISEAGVFREEALTTTFKVGDVVVYGRWGTEEAMKYRTADGQEYLILVENDILAVEEQSDGR